jgi:hypothetical protein
VSHRVAAFIVQQSDNEAYFTRCCEAHLTATIKVATEDGETVVVDRLSTATLTPCEFDSLAHP